MIGDEIDMMDINGVIAEIEEIEEINMKEMIEKDIDNLNYNNIYSLVF